MTQAESSPAEGEVKINSPSSIVEIYLTNNPACTDGGVWQSLETETINWQLKWENNQASVYAKFKDIFGKESKCISHSINFGNSSAPASGVEDTESNSNTSPSIIINDNAESTSSTLVSLSLAANNASDMYVSNTPGCNADGNWEAYSTSKLWSLGQTGGTATVYVRFRDASGNESTCINDTITHDGSGPAEMGI